MAPGGSASLEEGRRLAARAGAELRRPAGQGPGGKLATADWEPHGGKFNLVMRLGTGEEREWQITLGCNGLGRK